MPPHLRGGSWIVDRGSWIVKFTACHARVWATAATLGLRPSGCGMPVVCAIKALPCADPHLPSSVALQVPCCSPFCISFFGTMSQRNDRLSSVRPPTPSASPPWQAPSPSPLGPNQLTDPYDRRWPWYSERTPPGEFLLVQPQCPSQLQTLTHPIPRASPESPTAAWIDDTRASYKNKNRLAAAKCRAKKKILVDKLEGEHGVKKSVNALLRQTQLDLRDELSFWRMQALQHSCCGCHAIHKYNLRGAHGVAVGSAERHMPAKARRQS
ncbi:hypothetical protein ANO11243_009770 [Dothideomycetidae sp. 11243]|nr:hypothetical protein ANO11243_009770 [fungal sp. No.11243]